MLDFLRISTRSSRRGTTEIFPRFVVHKSEDLMIRGHDFYAIWNEAEGVWSTSEDTVIYLIDEELDNFAKSLKSDDDIRVLHLWDSETGMIDRWHHYVQKQMSDNYHSLDETLIFSNTPTSKENYASKRLPYALEKGPFPAWDELIGTLYSEKERHKIEWVIGSIVSGDSKSLQKFMVLYGSGGTGKSTIIRIIEKLFKGYFCNFDAKALGSASNAFALEAFRSNPLIGIQHDGDLSRIEDNTRLNSLVSHEPMTVNEKFKATYSNTFKTFLIMGTNKPVKITDAKSGIIRRLIDASPTGKTIPRKHYDELRKQINFELGAIAWHCLEVYQEDPQYYDTYIPETMLGATNDFYNFVLEYYSKFSEENRTTLAQAYALYDTYCNKAKVSFPFSRRIFKEELKNYFETFTEHSHNEWNIYSGFLKEKFMYEPGKKKLTEHKDESKWIFKEQLSLLDELCKDYPAQYTSDSETPLQKWANVTTTLKDIDTSKLHYLKVPENLIVIDFDIRGEDGSKSFERNLAAASEWPLTYAELSKSGEGIHLHYIYTGDPTKLSRIFSENVEIKVFTGNSSLRRKLTKCNDIPVASINSGLPMKGAGKVINFETVKNEKALRTLILNNLQKKYMPGTKPSCDFIFKVLQEAYDSGMPYDVTDLRPAVFEFAYNSTHQAEYCGKLANRMHFKSKEIGPGFEEYCADDLIFFDVEVFPNLFVVVYKVQGGTPVHLINPTPQQIENLIKYKLVGFNCRRYDNHILYAALMGYDNVQLFMLSQDIINGRDDCFFGEAYNLSYTDIYDFSSKKQSLKKFEIELGIHHQELGLPWDKPVPEELWETVAEYCENDVLATEAVFEDRKQDFIAREILADISGLTVNDTTRMHTTKIIFGDVKKPDLVYTDLATGEMTDGNHGIGFPGYSYEGGQNLYRGTNLGYGGYVYAEPGMYTNVALLDIASLHPHSIIAMNCFGEYTKNFKDILDARICIKHKDFEGAKKLLNGALAPYLTDEKQAKDLAQALKIVINSVYGYTSATFDNPFRDIRNKNNIVALRGALFMKTLQDEVAAKGFTVAHIKTDSIKIPNATPEIIQFCMDFAKQYGYSFEHEATYERMCLVNNAVYIAKYAEADWCFNEYGYVPSDISEHSGEWNATGAEFQVPYIFKTLFSHEPVYLEDLCETKEVKTALYLDFNEDLDEDTHDYQFVGRIGRFYPVKPGTGGGLLMRAKDDKYYAATGTKGYRWKIAELVTERERDQIDMGYFQTLLDNAVDEISKFGDFEWFTR